MNINSKYLKKLNDYYFQNARVVLVSGENGLLKSATINEFLEDKPHVIKISRHFGSYSLEAIYDAFYLFMKNNVKKYEKQYKSVEQLSMYEKLKFIWSYICSNFRMVLYFDDIGRQNDSVLEFIREIVLNLNTYKNNPLLIAEVDTSPDADGKMADFLNETFYKNTQIQYIRFSRYDNNELKNFLIDIYNKIDCSDKTLNYIFGNCYGNPGVLSLAMNILREKEYIRYIDDGIVVDEIPEGVLYEGFKNYIQRKFEKLSEQEQEALKSGSSMGITFDGLILSTVFQIVKVKEILSDIEESSQLIVQEQDISNANNSYAFSTYDIYKYIDNTVAQSTKREQHKKLSAYYYSLLTPKSRVIDHSLYIKNLYSYIHHAILAEQPMELRYKLIELLDFYQSINDLSNLIKLVDSLLPFYATHDLGTFAYMFFAKANALYYSGKYLEMVNMLDYLQRYKNLNDFQTVYLKYRKADAFLMLERTKDSEALMLDLEKTITNNRKCFCTRFEMQIFRSLASLYDFVNDSQNTIIYFIKSLKLSEELGEEDYQYSLYRQSSMCMPLTETRKMMQIAFNHFVQKNNLIEIAKCAHNIATDALYLNNPVDCAKYAEISLKTFESYGSLERVSILNTLAIYYALYEKKLEKAESTLHDALLIANSDWVEITILNNLNTVAIMMKNAAKSLNYIKRIEIDFSYALYNMLVGNREEARQRLMHIIKYEKTEYRHSALATMFYNDISTNKLFFAIDHEIYDYLKICHDANSFWGTIRFWET